MKYYTICSSSQSGTKFICAYLRHIKIGRPTELFSDNQLSELKSINQLIELGSQDRDYWDIKVFYRQLLSGINKLKELSSVSTKDDFKVLNTLFPGIKFVHYVRINKIKQAISQLKGGETSQAELCRRYNLSDDQLSKWKQQVVENVASLFTSTDNTLTRRPSASHNSNSSLDG